jgi:hypothetical protein
VCTILLDENLTGYLRYMDSLTFNDYWRDLTTRMGVRYVSLADVGLVPGTPDRGVWRLCQSNGYYLFTDNRTQSTDGSLGRIIADEGTRTSLPVFTIGDKHRFHNEREYAQEVVDRMLDYLFTPDNILGTGRLFLP